MGVYFMWVNRTRREYILPSDKRLRDNLKWPTGRSADVLFSLMRFGRWSGDQIEILSDTGDEWDDVLNEWRSALDVPENAMAINDVIATEAP